MRKIGIVTGASSGLGRAYAKQLDQAGGLDQLWLIARREERLQQLAGELACPCRVLALDLTEEAEIGKLQRALEEETTRVEVLVCAAGFGKFGRAEDMTPAENRDMIALNCRAAVEVTQVCLPHLHRGSRVLEVSSCASFQPLQGFGLYAATKAFLTSYTQSLRWELWGRGIRVSAVCPSWIKTEFMEVARQSENPNAVRHVTAVAQRPETVAAWSLRMNRAGIAVITCSPITFVQRIGAKVLPNVAIMGAWELMRRV